MIAVGEMEPPVESTNAELITEATTFAAWVLPSDGKVLLVRRERPDGLKYSVALETSPGGLAQMLKDSGFTTPLHNWMGTASAETIAGPPLTTSPRMQRGQDFYRSPDGDSMIRDVLIDERTSELRFVHLEFREQ
ncbi:hypothetical protein [Nocardia sp. NPDC050718]|uniref:hypothetical protein n=1 Tax=Nocardia sp. NPDC050718 TaxID=3155788 RepID=UPI0033FF2D26